MTADEWARAKALLADAAERPASERERYVIEHCADPDLRRELLALLATPAPLSALVATRALRPGMQLGDYVVEACIGSGGMGEVYRARDTRLGRHVAIKVLPPMLAADRERLARFEREATLLASVNHPNICTLFDVGRHADVNFIAMELLEGGTLGERIAGRPLPVPDVVDLAVQVADALDAAHRKGIVHRDIKPSNIFVTDTGQVKLLDVGLAKAAGPEQAGRAVSAPGVGPDTLTSPGTAFGTIAYMSPEQARGEELDARTDLFSFGAVLYEMATGRPPFTGSTPAVIFDAVLNATPPRAARLNPAVPPELDAIVTKALEKDRELRYQTAAELRADLKRFRRQSESAGGEPRSAAGPQTRRWRWSAAAAALLLIAAAAAAFVLGRRPASSYPVDAARWVPLTDFPDSAVWPALSADGRMLAFIRGPLPLLTSGQIYVKLLPNGESRQLTHDDAQKMQPEFSPDGSEIAYTVPFDTWTVPVLGGVPRVLMRNATGLTWVDGDHVLYSETGPAREAAVALSTQSLTDRRRLYVSPRRDRTVWHSYLSPDRQSLLLAGVTDPVRGIGRCTLVSVDGKSPPREIGAPAARCLTAAWSPDGRWMYLELLNEKNETHIWRQRFPDGAPEQVTAGPTVEHGIAIAPDGRSLVTSVGSTRFSAWIHDGRGDRPLSSEGLAWLEGGWFSGSRVYFGMSGPNQLWVADLTTGAARNAFPGVSGVDGYAISRDGKFAALILTSAGGERELWVAPTDRSAAPRRLKRGVGDFAGFGAGRHIYFAAVDSGGVKSVRRIDFESGQEETVLPGPIAEMFSISDAGDWALVARLREGPGSVTVAKPLRGGREVPLCQSCATQWSPDGRYLSVSFGTGAGAINRVHVLPIPAGSVVPELFASGPKSEEEIAAAIRLIPDARTIEQEDTGRIVIGSDPSTYAYQRMSTQRNLYRIPLS